MGRLRGLNEAAERLEIWVETRENRRSAAKAGDDFAGLTYGLKPVPFKESSFSAEADSSRRFS
jgi:hypothetical protein